MPGIFWIGWILLILGTGPVLVIMALAALGLTEDPNPNPIGPGILAMFTFYPSIALILLSTFDHYFR
jgi:hypothetical protein